MYSPKIGEELVPRLYRLAKRRKVPMTVLVNALLQEAVIEAERLQPTGPEAFQEFAAVAPEAPDKERTRRK